MKSKKWKKSRSESLVPKVLWITLGCPKNIADSRYLVQKLAQLVPSAQIDAQDDGSFYHLAVLNTCGFIQQARDHTYQTIELLMHGKDRQRFQKVVVYGCMVELAEKQIRERFPMLDGVFAIRNQDQLLAWVQNYLSSLFSCSGLCLGVRHCFHTDPELPHIAYLKIAEGCNRRCRYCTIPFIRGPLCSKTEEEILQEASALLEYPVKELILVAQDITSYGKDRYGEKRLPQLLQRLLPLIRSDRWLRLLYLHPMGFPTEILSIVADSPSVCKYLDLPIQHISNRMLKLMGRGGTRQQIEKLIALIRDKIPGVVIRTTVITGHPGERKEDHQELLQFLRDYPFERLGAFVYSPEPNTPAWNIEEKVPLEVAKERFHEIMTQQQEIAFQFNRTMVGKTIKVLVDKVQEGCSFCRSEYDAPDIDPQVLVKRVRLIPGSFVDVKIIGTHEYDLIGMPLLRNR